MSYTMTIRDCKGLNNMQSDIGASPEYLKTLDNAYITTDLKIKTRKPLEEIDSSPDDVHSLWTDGKGLVLFRASNGLYQLRKDKTIELITLRDEWNNKDLLFYCDLGQKLIMMDGDSGTTFNKITGKCYDFTLPMPNKPRLVRVATGGLPAGIYRVAITLVRDDGVESVLSDYSEIGLPSNSGFAVEVSTKFPDYVSFYNIYITEPNGGEFLFVRSNNMSKTVTDFINRIDYVKTHPTTLNLLPMKIGKYPTLFKSSLWVVVGNTLYFSEPFLYEYTTSKNFIQFEGAILDIAANISAEGSMIVNTTTGVYLINQNLERKKITDEPCIEGTLKCFNLERLGFLENPITSYGFIGMSKEGVIVITGNGVKLNLTQSYFVFDKDKIGDISSESVSNKAIVSGSYYIANI